MASPTIFFFYGTLGAGIDNAETRWLAPRIRKSTPARIRGQLFVIEDPGGAYPALIVPRAAPGEVKGTLVEMGPNFGPADLRRLDRYEDYRPQAPSLSLYLRREVDVTTGDGEIVRAETYIYNRPLPTGAERIEDGDFTAWLGRTGARSFGG